MGSFGASYIIYALNFGSSFVKIIISESVIVLKMLNKLLIEVLSSYSILQKYIIKTNLNSL